VTSEVRAQNTGGTLVITEIEVSKKPSARIARRLHDNRNPMEHVHESGGPIERGHEVHAARAPAVERAP
jgi:hypothetical protein